MSTKRPKKMAPNYRYSESFKLEIVSEIEKGKLTVNEASKLYEINGSNTIYKWLRKYGKNHLINKVVRIEMKDERNILKARSERIRELEEALATTILQFICAKCCFEEAESYMAEEEKTLFSRLLPEQQKVQRSS